MKCNPHVPLSVPLSALLSILLLSLLVPLRASAQDAAANFPVRPVTVIAATSPGGPTEHEVRLYLIKMTELMGKSFVMDFKAGAGNVIGSNYVAKSTPDGYTLLIVPSTFTAMKATVRDLPFDPLNDLTAVSQMSQRSTVLVVNSGLPIHDMKEYIAYARANPGKLNHGDAGVGGSSHLAAAWLSSATGIQVTYVHYKGTGPATLDLIAGRVDTVMESLTTMFPHIKSGKVRAIAITGNRRSPVLPDLPTVAEQAVPGFNFTSWLGIVAPAATPPAIVNKLGQNFSITAKSPEVVRVLEPEGNIMVGSLPAEFKQLIQAEAERWRKVVLDADIHFEE